MKPPLTVLGYRGPVDDWIGRALPQAELTVVPMSMATCFGAERLTSLGLSTRSPVYLDALAYRATDGLLEFEGLATLGRTARQEGIKHTLGSLVTQLDALVGATQVAAALGHDNEVVTGLVRLAVATAHARPRADRLPLVSLLIARAEWLAATELLASAERRTPGWEFATADLLNPYLRGPSIKADESLWLASVNAIFVGSGLEPVALDPDTLAPPLDRVVSAVEPVPRRPQDPLVTVIMSCFEPGRELLTAVRSIIAQTWQNWELLVMDDASGDDFSEILQAVDALDPRVRVVRSSSNAGTYVRRNDALELARGRYVTMHDSDDWAHPRRLELQVRHLMACPDTVANVAQSLRVTDELAFTQPRGARLHLAEPSLMFVRDIVLERIGFFDAVRRAADTEFRLRLEASFGAPPKVVAEGVPLLLMRYRRSSLSGRDLSDGWTHPGRSAYRSAHLLWRESTRRPMLQLPHPLEQRLFPAADHLLGVEQAAPTFDVLVALDGRRGTITHRVAATIAREWRAASNRGLRVGVIHVQAPHHNWIQPELHPALQQCISDGTVRQVLVGEKASTRLLIVRHAAAALGLPKTAAPLLTSQSALVVRDRASRLDVAGCTFSGAWCDRQVLAYAGITPSWHDAGSGGLELEALLNEASPSRPESLGR